MSILIGSKNTHNTFGSHRSTSTHHIIYCWLDHLDKRYEIVSSAV